MSYTQLLGMEKFFPNVESHGFLSLLISHFTKSKESFASFPSTGLSNNVQCLAPVADCGSFGCLALAAGGAVDAVFMQQEAEEI